MIQSIHCVQSKSTIQCIHSIQLAGTARRNSAVRPRQANIARGDLSSPNELYSDMCSIYYTHSHKNNMRQTKITRRCLSWANELYNDMCIVQYVQYKNGVYSLNHTCRKDIIYKIYNTTQYSLYTEFCTSKHVKRRFEPSKWVVFRNRFGQTDCPKKTFKTCHPITKNFSTCFITISYFWAFNHSSTEKPQLSQNITLAR